MAFFKEEGTPKKEDTPKKEGLRPQRVTSVTREEQRALLEEELTKPIAVDGQEISEEDVAELARLYRLSAPIQIPNGKLDPNYEYRWINKNPKNFRRRRGVGWKVVKKADLVRLSKVPFDELHMGTHFGPDETLCLGDDLVFAYIPKRIAEAMRLAQLRESQARLGGARQQFHDAGKMTGVETYDKDAG